MSKPPNNIIKLSETLTLCEYTAPRNGNFGFWLYDKTRGMNLSMRALTSADAFVEALTYYQKRLAELERAHQSLQSRVDDFVSQFTDNSEEY